MAKRKTRRRARRRASSTQVKGSVLTREEIFLNKHDEEKVLLFLTGLVFGMGLVATIMDKFLFGGLSLLVVGLVLLLIELNVEEKAYRI